MKAVKIRYYLKLNENPTQKALVMCSLNGGFTKIVNGKRTYDKKRLSLEYHITPSHFGYKEENYTFDETVFKKFSKYNASLKTKMQQLETAVNEVENHFNINKIQPTADQFQNELKIKLERINRAVNTTTTIYEYLLDKIDTFDERIGSNRKDEMKINTIKIYTTLSKYILKYQSATNSILYFDTFDLIKYNHFWNIQDEILKGNIAIQLPNERKQKTQANGFKVNSIIKYQKTLKKILGLAKKDGITIAIDLEDENLVLEETDNTKDIYINQSELQKIIDYVPTSTELKQAKDYVIIASLTGMRYESMVEINKAKIEECIEPNYNFKFLHDKQNKTNTECYIPLLKPVLDVIKENNNQLPSFTDNSTLNSNLKSLFTNANIKTQTEVKDYTFSKGNIVKSTSINEIVTSHDLRKSFATNLYLMNLAQTQIDNVTHPDKPQKNAMATVYNKATMLDKAKMFVDELNKVNKLKNSSIYTL